MSYENSYKNCMDAHRVARKLTMHRQSTAATENRYSISDLDRDMDLAIAGRASATGVNVTSNTALNCVPYMAGVRLISETIGQMPLIEYRRLSPRGKERATDRTLYRLLHDAPNPEMDAVSFKTALQSHAVTWGNAFAEIVWNADGFAEALYPLNVSKMRVGRDSKTKELIYAYTLPDGITVKIPPYRVWHMSGFGFDGIIGYDTISLAKEAIGMALAMEEYGARFFVNGAAPGGVLEHPNKLSTQSQENLRKTWAEMHQGLGNQHRIAILEEGMTYKSVGIPPENAQFMESRLFQIQEIARLLHIPPHMLAELSRGTFSNIEQQGIEYVQYSMTPWFVRWEQTCNRKLHLPNELSTFFFEFLIDALLRGDSVSRANLYRQLFYMGAMSPNDIREKENHNPISDPAGDKYYVQSNMIPLDKIGQIPPTQSPGNDNSVDAMRDCALRRIAEREKQNIIRASRKNDESGFRIWLADYYRDFSDYIKRQLEPIIGDECINVTQRYVDTSRKLLDGVKPENVESVLTNWEVKRPLLSEAQSEIA